MSTHVLHHVRCMMNSVQFAKETEKITSPTQKNWTEDENTRLGVDSFEIKVGKKITDTSTREERGKNG